MLRVTAGSLRGRRVPVPPGDVSPTSERARQAYFNISGPRIAGARFLDLFAGSGIFSFEAVSRGAASATAIDQSRRNCETIARLAAVRPHVADGGLVAIEHRRRTQPFTTPPGRVAEYGEVWISFFS